MAEILSHLWVWVATVSHIAHLWNNGENGLTYWEVNVLRPLAERGLLSREQHRVGPLQRPSPYSAAFGSYVSKMYSFDGCCEPKQGV